ncbi:MAG TPA: endonuclease V [Solirubrobacteraceae bacterium]|nr:endonuclease V [Solirubrobacteraceae bacterium]
MTAARWPASAAELAAVQFRLAAARPPPWLVPDPPAACAIGGCFVCFARGQGGRGTAGEPGWAAAAVWAGSRPIAAVAIDGTAGAPYDAGLLALREGPLLAAAVQALERPPAVLLVNATGRDHPRRAGLALHLGAVLELPTVGVTHRPLQAQGPWPPPEAGARSPLRIGAEEVGWWLRTHAGARPLAVHPGWRTDAPTACAVVLAAAGAVRTPQPLREARRLARARRARARPRR